MSKQSEQLSLDMGQAYREVARSEDGLELAPKPLWQVDVGEEAPAPQTKLPADAVRVALLRVAGVEDTVALGMALGISPPKICMFESLPGYVQAVQRLRMSAGLGNWRSHVEATVATGILPSGTAAPAPTQAQLLSELWAREEPKVVVGAVDEAKTVIVFTGDAMARITGGLAEARRTVVDVTPRTQVPHSDAELERQRRLYGEVGEGEE